MADGDWVFREAALAAPSGSRAPATGQGKVRQYERRNPRTGLPEEVRPYERRWWIPHPDWLKGEQRWITAGEEAWRQKGEQNWAKGRKEGEAGGGGGSGEATSQDRAAAEAADDAREGESDLPPWARTPANGQPLTREDRPPQAGLVGVGTMHERPVHGYARPNTDRLVNEKPKRGQYRHPSEHPFFKDNPISKQNIIDAYDSTTRGERFQGRRWYPDMARLAWALGGGDARQGAMQLSAYSPRSGWPINMFNAARALAQGKELPKGYGVMEGVHTKMSRDAFAHDDYDKVFNGPKTNAFARLGETGLDHPGDPLGALVLDTHAMSVAAGHPLADPGPLGKDPYYTYVADMYRDAAADISERDGEEISPSELQAITWLRQQRVNEEDVRRRAEAGEREAKGQMGLYSAMRTAWRKWADYAREHGIRTELGTTELGPHPITKAEIEPRGSTGPGASQPVSYAEFHDLATRGRDMLAQMAQDSSPPAGLTENFDSLAQNAWQAVQESWGGVTIDAHSGEMLTGNEDKYAVSAKPVGVGTISIPENATEAQFRRAMDRAIREFGPLLSRSGHFLGIFHDDSSGRIDFDPVVVANSLADANAIGTYTRNVGGAYHFASGTGYWPPHVTEP